MYWFKRLLVTAIWIFIVQTLQAQEHYNTWFRGTLSIPVGEKFKIDNELQHRRQNGFENENMLNENLMFTFRNWVHYQHNEDIKFSLSPFAYFKHYRIIQKHSDETAIPNGIRYDFTGKLKVGIFDELLFNLSGTTYHHFFDHDRLGLNVEYKFVPNVKFDIGYMHITRLPLTSTTKLHENNLYLNFTYQLKKTKSRVTEHQFN